MRYKRSYIFSAFQILLPRDIIHLSYKSRYIAKEEEKTQMDGYVEMDNMRKGPNHIMNVLWELNREATLGEITACARAKLHVRWSRWRVKRYINYLLKTEYAVVIRRGDEIRYAALGYDLEWE